MAADEGIVGKHIIANVYKVADSKKLWDREFLEKVVVEACKIANMKIVEVKSWEFGGEKGGVSVIALVEESHVAIHTWKEYRYATIDVYTCGEKSKPIPAVEHILKNLGAESTWLVATSRSQKGDEVIKQGRTIDEIKIEGWY